MHYYHSEDSKPSFKTVGIRLRGQKRKKVDAGKRKKCLLTNPLKMFQPADGSTRLPLHSKHREEEALFLRFYYSVERRETSTGEVGQAVLLRVQASGLREIPRNSTLSEELFQIAQQWPWDFALVGRS